MACHPIVGLEVSIRPWHQFSEQLFEEEDTCLPKEVLFGQIRQVALGECPP